MRPKFLRKILLTASLLALAIPFSPPVNAIGTGYIGGSHSGGGAVSPDTWPANTHDWNNAQYNYELEYLYSGDQHSPNRNRRQIFTRANNYAIISDTSCELCKRVGFCGFCNYPFIEGSLGINHPCGIWLRLYQTNIPSDPDVPPGEQYIQYARVQHRHFFDGHLDSEISSGFDQYYIPTNISQWDGMGQYKDTTFPTISKLDLSNQAYDTWGRWYNTNPLVQITASDMGYTVPNEANFCRELNKPIHHYELYLKNKQSGKQSQRIGTSVGYSYSDPGDYSSNIPVTYEGRNTVFVRPVDMAGNPSTSYSSVSYLYDATAPFISTCQPSYKDNYSYASINVAATDLCSSNNEQGSGVPRTDAGSAGWYITHDQGKANSYKGDKFDPNTYQIRANGTYYIYCVDYAGNYSAVHTLSVTQLDSDPPEVIVSLDPSTVTKSLNVVITAGDNIKPTQFIISGTEPTLAQAGWAPFSSYTNGTNRGHATWPLPSGGNVNGDYTVWVRDAAGNISEPAVAKVRNIDIYRPAITNLAVDKQEWSTSKTITVTANDTQNVPSSPSGILNSGVAGYYMSKSRSQPSASASGWQSSNKFTINANGTYYFWVKDGLGQISDTHEITVNTIDTTPPTPPTLVVNRKDNGANVGQRVWTNSDVTAKASGAEALSGISGYEYRISGSNTSTAMAPYETVMLIERLPNGKDWSYTDVKSATIDLSKDHVFQVRAVSNSGLTSSWISFDLYLDKLQPDANDYSFSPATSSWTNKPFNLTFRVDDTDSDGSSEKSGIQYIRFLGTSKSPAIDWKATTSTMTVSVKDSAVYKFEAKDKAGNIRQYSYTIKNFDDVSADLWITDPTQLQDVPESQMPVDREWVNTDITLTAHAKDKAPPTPPSGVKSITTPEKTVVKNSNGTGATTEYTEPFTAEKNGVYSFSTVDAGGNVTKVSYEVWNIDKIRPTAEWTEDVEYYKGTSTIYVVADDDWSGVDYIELPNGDRVYSQGYPHGYEIGDAPMKVSTAYTINQNGIYSFKIVDRAGNFITKTFEYTNLRVDYGISDFNLDEPLAVNTDVDVSMTLLNKEGEGKDVSLKLYYKDGTQNVVLASERLDIPMSTKDGPGKLPWKGTINLGNKTNITEIYAVVGEELLLIDLHPEDNTAMVSDKDGAPFDLAISTDFTTKFAHPNQVLEVPFQATGTGVGDAHMYPVEFTMNGERVTRSFVTLGKDSNPVLSTVRGIIPADIKGKAPLAILLNWEDRDKETNTENNRVLISDFQVQEPDLSLGISGDTLTGVDGDPTVLTPSHPQGKFMYPAKFDEYEVTFSAVNKNEIIKTIVTNGETIVSGNNTHDYTLTLDRNEEQEFTIVVESACGQYQQPYHVTIKRGEDNIDVNVSVKLPNGDIYPGTPGEDGNYEIHIPVTSTDYDLIVGMVDPDANIVTIDSDTINSNEHEKPDHISSGGKNDYVVTVESEDKSRQNTFEVVVTNENFDPKVVINNKSEIQGNIYGLGGILDSDTFIPYGNDITSLEIAHRAGRTNGVVVQVKVTDMNPEQYLRGYLEVPNSTVKYDVRWNTFDGPTVMKVSDIDFGYIYIDRTSMREDMPLSEAILHVSDYVSDSESDTALSEGTDKVAYAIDITAPEIITTPDEFAGTEENPKGTVALQVTDAFTGVERVEWRVSKDGGRNWTDPVAFSDNGTIELIDADGKPLYGDLTVEITAWDKIKNKNSNTTLLSITGPDLSTNSDVYATTNRVSDVVFINTRKDNMNGNVNQQTLDTFK